MTHRTCLALAWAAALAAPAAALADRIAYVDMRRAISESNEGKDLQKTLRAEVEKKAKELDEERGGVRKLLEELEKQESALKPDVAAQRRRELQEKYMKVERHAAEVKRELARKEAEALRPIADKMLLVIATIAQREKFSHVLRQEIVLWTESRALDITNEVIRLADAAYAKAKEKAPEKD